jgi:hypothetical protein
MPCSRARYSTCSATTIPGYSPLSSGRYPKRHGSEDETGVPFPSDFSLVERHQAEDCAHGGRLSCTVGPEEAEHRTGGHCEGQAVEREHITVTAGQALELEHPGPGTLKP